MGKILKRSTKAKSRQPLALDGCETDATLVTDDAFQRLRGVLSGRLIDLCLKQQNRLAPLSPVMTAEALVLHESIAGAD